MNKQITQEHIKNSIIENQLDITGWSVSPDSTMREMIKTCMDEYAEWAIKQLEPKWISVKDGLPKEGQQVLVFVPDIDKVAITFYNHFEEWNNTGFVYRGVTHWMPLPEPTITGSKH